MPSKINIPVSMGMGLDQKTDPKQVAIGAKVALTNAIFQTPKEIRKRPGYAALTQNIQGGGTIARGLGIAAYNDELTLMDGDSLYSLNESGPNWVDKGILELNTVSQSTIVRTANNQSAADAALNGNLRGSAWTDSSGGLRYSIFDTATGQSIVDNQVLSASGQQVQVVALGVYLVFVYGLSPQFIVYKAVDTTNPTVLGPEITVNGDAFMTSSQFIFDVSLFNNTAYITYSHTTDTTHNGIYTISSSLVLSTKHTYVVARNAHFSIAVSFDVSGNIYLTQDSLHTALSSISFVILSPTFTSIIAETNIDTLNGTFGATSIRNITTTIIGTKCYVFYDGLITITAAANPLDQTFVKQAAYTLAGVLSGPEFYILGDGIAGRAFVYSGQVYFLSDYASTLQNTYFLMRGNLTVDSTTNFVNTTIAKISEDVGGGLVTTGNIPHFLNPNSTTFQYATLLQDETLSLGGVISHQTGVMLSGIEFASIAPSKIVLGNNLLIASGLLMMYDGAAVVEHGYSIFPEDVAATLTNGFAVTGSGGIGVGNSGSTGQKQYVATYEWIDNQGQTHRSAPSIPATVSLNAFKVVSGLSATFTAASASVTGVTGGTFLVNQWVTILTSNKANQALSTTGLTLKIQAVGVGSFTLSAALPAGFTTGAYDFILTTNIPAYVSSGSYSAGSNALLVSTISQDVAGNASVIVGQQLYTVPGNVFPTGTYVKSITGSIGNWTVTMSNPATATSVAGVTEYIPIIDTGSVHVVVPTLRQTEKTNVMIVVYATTLNGENFFRVGSVANDPTAMVVSLNDTYGDLYLEGNNILYTTGGVLENIEVPAPSFLTSFKSRAIVKPSETNLEWEYSQQVVPGSPVEFNDALVQNIDAKIIDFTACGVVDEKLILFGPNSKYYVVGDGPSPSGLNNDFIYPQKLTGTTGCQNQSSIIEIPHGIIYQDANKGIYLLDRSLQEQYIGAPVEAYNAQTVVSATLVPGFEMIRFALGSGTILTYDYITGQWSTDAAVDNIVDACVFDNEYCYLGPDGLVFEETPGAFSDNGAYIPMSLQMGWMNFADIQGFLRVHEVQLFGEFFSAHTLTVSIYYDYATSPTQVRVIPVPTDPTNFDGGYQFRIKLARQKCESIMIQIQESGSTPGQGFSLSGLSFRVAVKAGLNKLPAGVSY